MRATVAQAICALSAEFHGSRASSLASHSSRCEGAAAMSDTIRAVVAQHEGEPADVLRLESRPRPEPGDGQVLVRVRAAPVHATDLHIMRGRYGYTPEFPTVLGSESVGEVEAVGPGVDSVEVGQRVVTVLVSGTWQEFVVVPG